MSQILQTRACGAENPHQSEQVCSKIADNWWSQWAIRTPVGWSISLRFPGWRSKRFPVLLNLILPLLLLSYWNWGKFLLKCTVKSPDSFTLCFYRNEEPSGIILLFCFGDTYHNVFFSCIGLSSEINCKRMFWWCSYQYVQCSISLVWFLFFLDKIPLFSCFWLCKNWI